MKSRIPELGHEQCSGATAKEDDCSDRAEIERGPENFVLPHSSVAEFSHSLRTKCEFAADAPMAAIRKWSFYLQNPTKTFAFSIYQDEALANLNYANVNIFGYGLVWALRD